MYLPEIEEVLRKIQEKKIMVMETSLDGKVTARNMSVVVLRDRIYCQTDRNMTKAQQIMGNENVAFCVDNFQICGKAKIIGKWDENPEILVEYRKFHNDSYEKYKSLKDEVVIETKIEEIETWEYRNGKPYIVTIDLNKNLYHLKEYKVN
ncbi:MAG: pyridoxamine 5'-phosphate oxidase family protein [Brevinematia bacterium]